MRRVKSSKRMFPGEDLDLVENYGDVVRDARMKLGLTQEDLAKQLNEKLTVIKKIEAGEFKPPMDLAKRLERFLKVRLLEPVEEPSYVGSNKYPRKGEAGMSLGDLLKKDEGKR